MLLNSCEEEDSLLYPQYEYIMNNQETHISDLLTNSQAENNIQSSLLFFNKEEGLIELQHIKLLDDGEIGDDTDSYITTWKIRPADVNLVKDWKQDNVINIDKTSIFSRYTMFGESLEYTLTNTNHNKSVRANFVCKSSNQNTYNILSIDYLENIVVLENGPCLFMHSGDLKEWHVKDTVVLQRHVEFNSKQPLLAINKRFYLNAEFIKHDLLQIVNENYHFLDLRFSIRLLLII